jgi:hypothetical protein
LRISRDGIEDRVKDHGPLTALRGSDEVGDEVHSQSIDTPLRECLDMATRTASHIEYWSLHAFEDPQVHLVGVVQPSIDLELKETPI